MIVFIDQSGELGGAELSLLDILATGVGKARVILFSDGPLRERLEAVGVPVSILKGGGVSSIRRRSGLLSAVKSIPALGSLIFRVAAQSKDKEVFYANTQKAFVVAALASALARRPVIWHLHDILSSDHFSRQMRQITVRLANARASCVIVNSRASGEAFRRAGGRTKTRVIYNGIDRTPFESIDAAAAQTRLRAELGVPAGPLLGNVGRLCAWKGQHVLIEALKELPTCHAVLVGSALFGEAQYEAELRRLVSQARIGHRVHFLGFRDDVAAIMRGVDVIVHTSIAPEPFGRVVVEGMLAGKPVIATRAGGVAEVVKDGVTGLLVTPGDASALNAAVRQLIANPELARNLGAQAKVEATNCFELGAYADSIRRTCEDVLNGG